MTFTREEAEQLYICIGCRIGIIETGEPLLRATDVARMDRDSEYKIRALSREQRDLISMLEDVQMRLLNEK